MTAKVVPDRTERLLALLLLQQNKTASLADKAHLLNLADYSNLEIADLLETTPAVVAQKLYELRKAGAKKKKPKTK